MYREALLPSGQPMAAGQPLAAGQPMAAGLGATVPGTAFACAGCHLRAGLGRRAGRVPTPPIAAGNLFAPRYRHYPELAGPERDDLPEALRTPLRRPAYTDATLLAAIRDGVDPTGRPLDAAMPRYPLDDAAAGHLLAYLKTLSRNPSPGVTETTLAFATVIAGPVSAQDRIDLVTTLEHQVALHNTLRETTRSGAFRSLAMKEAGLAYRTWSLAVWDLHGPPATWRAQLEAYQRAAPVFALAGGLSYGDWAPIHRFCADAGLPCLLPLTDFPVPGPGPTVYFSGGLRQEGAAAAVHLAAKDSSRTVLQVVQPTPEARALAAGFQGAWTGPLVTLTPPRLTAAYLAKVLRRHPKAILALWAGPEAYPALRRLAAGQDCPDLVLMSATHLGQAVWDLPQQLRPNLLLTYPYRLERPASPMAPSGPTPVRLVTVDNDRRVRSRAFAVMQVLNDLVGRMGRGFHREHFLDTLGQLEDRDDTDYPWLNFGPGQTTLSSGSYLVRLPQGPLHGFIRQGDWVTP